MAKVSKYILRLSLISGSIGLGGRTGIYLQHSLIPYSKQNSISIKDPPFVLFDMEFHYTVKACLKLSILLP